MSACTCVKRPRMPRDRAVSGESNHELDSIGIRKALRGQADAFDGRFNTDSSGIEQKVLRARACEMYRTDMRELSCKTRLERYETNQWTER